MIWTEGSKYAHDPRVTAGPNDSYMVDVNGADFIVEYKPALAWTIVPAPTDVDISANWVVGYDSPDDAFLMLIGDPK